MLMELIILQHPRKLCNLIQQTFKSPRQLNFAFNSMSREFVAKRM